jgi:hypothetical protein
MKVKKINRIIIIVLGTYQLTGGLYGLQAVFQQSISLIFKNLFPFTIIIGLFVYSIICGSYLLFNNGLRKGIKLSLINQILQMIRFEIFGNGFYYIAGSYLALRLNILPVFGLSLDYSLFRSYCFIDFLVNSNTLFIAINIISLSILLYLSYLLKYFNNA